MRRGEGWIIEGHEETVGGDGKVQCLDCADGFMLCTDAKNDNI